MTTILAIDTSGDACSCAIVSPDYAQHTFEIIPRQQAAQILPMVHALMHKAGLGFSDLDAIAFGQGPGSFTGLRIAAGVTQGIAFAANLPVVPVSTLAALAWQACQKHADAYVLSLIDARIDEVYWGLFDCREALPLLVDCEQLTAPEKILPGTEDNQQMLTAVGNGLLYVERFPANLQSSINTAYPQELPSAVAIARLGVALFAGGQFITAEQVQPVYLRDQVARKPGASNAK